MKPPAPTSWGVRVRHNIGCNIVLKMYDKYLPDTYYVGCRIWPTQCIYTSFNPRPMMAPQAILLCPTFAPTKHDQSYMAWGMTRGNPETNLSILHCEYWS